MSLLYATVFYTCIRKKNYLVLNYKKLKIINIYHYRIILREKICSLYKITEKFNKRLKVRNDIDHKHTYYI